MADTLTREQRSRQMARVRSRDTVPELIVRGLVHGWGYRYRLHVPALPGRPDLVFPRLRKVIFVHGCFWHQHHCQRGDRLPTSRVNYWREKLDRNKRRDKRHCAALRKLGWKVLVVWECETAARRRDKLAKRMLRFLSA
jgi:DNA mismatch endonuclease, patch repair protein